MRRGRYDRPYMKRKCCQIWYVNRHNKKKGGRRFSCTKRHKGQWKETVILCWVRISEIGNGSNSASHAINLTLKGVNACEITLAGMFVDDDGLMFIFLHLFFFLVIISLLSRILYFSYISGIFHLDTINEVHQIKCVALCMPAYGYVYKLLWM